MPPFNPGQDDFDQWLAYNVVPLNASGSGNMGTVTDVDSPCRFWLPNAERTALVYVRFTFTAGSGDADCYLKIDSRLMADDLRDKDAAIIATPEYDHLIWTWPDVGTDVNNINWRIARDELAHWTIYRGDQYVMEWTNPDSGTMRWAGEVGLVDLVNGRSV